MNYKIENFINNNIINVFENESNLYIQSEFNKNDNINKTNILIESINSIEKDNSSKFFSYDCNGFKTINDNEKNEENNFIKEKEEIKDKKK